MRSLPFALALSLGLAACAPPAPAPSTPPPEVLVGGSAIRPIAAILDPYAGRYASGGEQLTVRRSGDSLVIERAGQPPLWLTLVGLGTFADAAGNSYLFTTGAGGRLALIAADGARREWAR